MIPDAPADSAASSAGQQPTARELQRYFRGASFAISAAKFAQCPLSPDAEVAFAGRSNAGKSSALNLICDQKSLARTSKTPGRTQLLNFFTLPDGKQLVDLPGYGFAKVSEAKKLQWQKELGRYLEKRDTLVMLVLLVDCRHGLQPYDRMMLDWSAANAMPCHLLLTKSDKLSRNKARQALFTLQRELASIEKAGQLCSTQLFSSHSGEGLDEARAAVYAALQRLQASG